MTPHPLALHPIERGYLYAFGILRFPPHKEAPRPPGRTVGRKNRNTYGRVKEMALRYVQGAFPGLTVAQVAARFRMNQESLKSAEWKLRREMEGAA